VSGKNPSEAIDNFLKFLRESLSCVTAETLIAYQKSSKLHKVFFNPPARVTTQNGGNRFISIAQVFSVTDDLREPGRFKVTTKEYSYVFSDSQASDAHGIVAYHWHPNDFAVHCPHLHVREARKVHFPTSRVCLEDFVALLIDYYQVVPTVSMSQWKRILKKNKAAFDKYATWKIQAPGI
jgi:hypothetical protein